MKGRSIGLFLAGSLSLFALAHASEGGGHGGSPGGGGAAPKKTTNAPPKPKPKPLPQPGADASLLFRLSAAENELEAGRLEKAYAAFLEIDSDHPGQPDAQLGLARVHFEKNLVSVAMKHLVVAEENRRKLRMPDAEGDLHLAGQAIYRKAGRPDLEERSLWRLVAWGSNSVLTNPTTASRSAQGKGRFALGLLYREQGREFDSRRQFETAFDLEWRKRSAALHVADWFASKTQDDLDALRLKWNREHPDATLNREPRLFWLNRWLRRYEMSEPVDLEEVDYLRSEGLLKLIARIPEWKRQIEKQENPKPVLPGESRGREGATEESPGERDGHGGKAAPSSAQGRPESSAASTATNRAAPGKQGASSSHGETSHPAPHSPH